ncbi:hypothetical protein KKG05_05470 [bacterium]|nr:hypothetical protein [bacterium]
MKRTLSILTILAALTIVSSEAFATASTHIWAPSADVQAFNLWHITSDIYLPVQPEELPGGGAQYLPSITNLGITVGVLPFEKVQAEVGVDHKSGLGALDVYPLYFNAKIGIPEQAFGQFTPALAVGIYDVGTKTDMTNINIIYGKAAYTVPSIGRVSLGYFTGDEKLLLDSEGEKDNAGLMAAWERTMTEISDRLWVCVEYMGTQSGYGTMNFGFSWAVSDNASLLLGYDVFNDQDMVGVENTFTVQVDIDLKLLGE